MKATKCDRCGMYFDYPEEVNASSFWSDCEDVEDVEDINGFAFLSYDQIEDRYMVCNIEYNLCPDCVQSLKAWFEALREDDEQQ